MNYPTLCVTAGPYAECNGGARAGNDRIDRNDRSLAGRPCGESDDTRRNRHQVQSLQGTAPPSGLGYARTVPGLSTSPGSPALCLNATIPPASGTTGSTTSGSSGGASTGG